MRQLAQRDNFAAAPCSATLDTNFNCLYFLIYES